MRIYCETYRCDMSAEACVKRQKNAQAYQKQNAMWGPGRIKPGSLDINCRNCEQGKKIMEEFKKNKNQENSDKLLHFCQDPDCELKGVAQPLENFRQYKNGTISKNCMKCAIKKRNKTIKKRKADEKENLERLKRLEKVNNHDQIVKDLLKKRPELLQNLEKLAKNQERTLTGQLFYALKIHLITNTYSQELGCRDIHS